jgi:hypothetical protein
MSATIRLSATGADSGVELEFQLARIVYWHVREGESGLVTIVYLDGLAVPVDVLGDHAATLRAALDATVSKVDEDVELIASLTKRVEALERARLTWTREPPTRPGVYWRRCLINSNVRVTAVFEENGHLFDQDEEPLAIMSPKYFEWAGPIAEPEVKP